jgi:hypothetical protein
MTSHFEYADEAESAERGNAWPQALALWKRAIATSEGQTPAAYHAGVARCEDQIAVDADLASIARRVLGIPTLATRNSDDLDFHEIAVWSLQEALRLAHAAGRKARPEA